MGKSRASGGSNGGGPSQTDNQLLNDARARRDEVGDVFDSRDRFFIVRDNDMAAYNAMVGMVEEFGDNVDDKVLSEDEVKATIMKHGQNLTVNMHLPSTRFNPPTPTYVSSPDEAKTNEIFDAMQDYNFIIPVGDGSYITNVNGFHMTRNHVTVRGADALRQKVKRDTSD